MEDAPDDKTWLSAENLNLLDKAMDRLKSQMAQDPQLQATLADPESIRQVQSQGTAIEVFLESCRLYADKPAFGSCFPGMDATYEMMTYTDVLNTVQWLATGLTELGSLTRGDFLAVAGYCSRDWVLADIVGMYMGCPVVPVPLNVMAEDSVVMLRETEARCIFCSAEEVASMAIILTSCPDVTTVVLMDTHHAKTTAAPHIEKFRKGLRPSTTFLTIEDLVEIGAKAQHTIPPAIPGQDGVSSNPLVSLMYTSGSSGTPKGGMFMGQAWTSFWKYGFRTTTRVVPPIQLAYLPLNHVVGRLSIFRTFSHGGITYFIRNPDLSTFFQDLQIARPTTLILIPRISNMLYETYLLKLSEIPKDLDEASRKSAEEEVQKWVVDLLGGRVVYIVSGTAPTSPEVLNFLTRIVGVAVIDIYGSTEIGGVLVDHHINWHVLEDYKLVSVPELDYTVEDKPYPRGEFRVKSRYLIAGYYKDPEKSKELLDEEGFTPTGDIMEERAPGVLYWCDRRKNILKLAQGEFVSLWRLEAFFSASPLIHQVYLYGHSLRSFLVGVIVPSQSLQSLFAQEEHESMLQEELQKVAREHGLQPYEVPREFIIEYTPFSKVNNLLTDSNKLARAALKKRYGDELEGLYASIEEKTRMKRESVVTGNGGATLEEPIWGVVERTLGVDRSAMGTRRPSFVQLGGDSIAALRLVEQVERISEGVRLPVSAVLNPTASIDSLVELVTELQKAGGQEKIPRGRVDVVRASDLTLERFFSEEQLSAVKAMNARTDVMSSTAKNIFLTGANGFLGRHMALELLKRVAPVGGCVYCLVRSQSDEQAMDRMMQSYDTADGNLRALVEDYKSNLIVLSGDVILPRLGLSQSKWEELSLSLDTIIHAGALVNHAFSYEQLYQPNILGTVEVMKLAMTGSPKTLSFISSVAVAFDQGLSVVTEDQYGTKLQQERKAGGSYAAGYGASKWACEVLLQRASEEYGVPVKIFRSSLILAHREWLGQINASDFLTRLLCGLIYTNLAPASFLAQPQGKNHFDGSPVDFVAEAITALSLRRDPGCTMYHCVNPHEDDGVSLDVLVQWAEKEGGFHFQRVEDYHAWVQAFRAKLEALERKKKAQSPLAILNQWEEPQPPNDSGTRLDAALFQQGVKEVTKEGDVPILDARFMRRCLEHMQAINLVSLER